MPIIKYFAYNWLKFNAQFEIVPKYIFVRLCIINIIAFLYIM